MVRVNVALSMYDCCSTVWQVAQSRLLRTMPSPQAGLCILGNRLAEHQPWPTMLPLGLHSISTVP